MDTEELIIDFKRRIAKPSKTERRRAIEAVRDMIRAVLFDDAADSSFGAECCSRCD